MILNAVLVLYLNYAKPRAINDTLYRDYNGPHPACRVGFLLAFVGILPGIAQLTKDFGGPEVCFILWRNIAAYYGGSRS